VAGPAARILNPPSLSATNGATRATRREAWVTGVAAGPVLDSYRRIPPVRWLRPYLIEGVLALLLRRDQGRGREGFEDP